MRLSTRWVACFGVAIVGVGLVAISAGADQARRRAERGRGDDQGTRHQKCSLATLKGAYIFAGDGVDVDREERTALAGREVYNGDGTMTGDNTISTEGEISSLPYTGTYTLDANCRGTLVVQAEGFPKETFHIFVKRNGKEFTWVRADPGWVSAGWERRDD